MFASDCARLIGTCGKQSCQMLDQSQWQTVIWDGREGNEVSPITTLHSVRLLEDKEKTVTGLL